jgi:hypothetical protein
VIQINGRLDRLKFRKHEPALKALAIRKKQIHVVGTPVWSKLGYPIYFDVELVSSASNGPRAIHQGLGRLYGGLIGKPLAMLTSSGN